MPMQFNNALRDVQINIPQKPDLGCMFQVQGYLFVTHTIIQNITSSEI